MSTNAPIMFNQELFLNTLSFSVPSSYAYLFGISSYSSIYGLAYFYPAPNGTLVIVQVTNLPITLPSEKTPCPTNIFALHIHEGSTCLGTKENPLQYVGGHYNPTNCPHPAHIGDLPPLFASKTNGFAWSCFFTDRFTPTQVQNHTIIVHKNPDDFTTQPSDNPGEMIACGSIQPFR